MNRIKGGTGARSCALGVADLLTLMQEAPASTQCVCQSRYRKSPSSSSFKHLLRDISRSFHSIHPQVDLIRVGHRRATPRIRSYIRRFDVFLSSDRLTVSRVSWRELSPRLYCCQAVTNMLQEPHQVSCARGTDSAIVPNDGATAKENPQGVRDVSQNDSCYKRNELRCVRSIPEICHIDT